MKKNLIILKNLVQIYGEECLSGGWKVNPCDVDYKSALCVDNVKTTRAKFEFSKIPGVEIII